MIDQKSCDYINLVKYIYSADEIISSKPLILGINVLQKWCQNNNLEGETSIDIIETDYTNYDTQLN